MKPHFKDLNKALTYHLEGMYDAEKQIIDFIPGCVKHATSHALKDEIRKYGEMMADERVKLKRIFGYLLTGPYGRKATAVGEMLQDIKQFSKAASSAEVKDVVIIAGLQLLIHYKISAYGTGLAFAEQLGLDTAAELLAEMLDWEKATNKALSRLALGGLNQKAAALSLVSS